MTYIINFEWVVCFIDNTKSHFQLIKTLNKPKRLKTPNIYPPSHPKHSNLSLIAYIRTHSRTNNQSNKKSLSFLSIDKILPFLTRLSHLQIRPIPDDQVRDNKHDHDPNGDLDLVFVVLDFFLVLGDQFLVGGNVLFGLSLALLEDFRVVLLDCARLCAGFGHLEGCY